MNVKATFSNGDLDEEVYMRQPKGFVVPGQEHRVCKLLKSLYGLKQAPKQWHQKFHKVVFKNDFHINDANKCVYTKFTSDKGVIVCLFVDDMLICGTNLKRVENTKIYLSQNFDMKDLGKTNVILGNKITQADNGLMLSQLHYI